MFPSLISIQVFLRSRCQETGPSLTPSYMHHLIKICDFFVVVLNQNDCYFHWDYMWAELVTLRCQHNVFLHGGRILPLPRDVFLRSWGHLMGRAQCKAVWPNHIQWRVILIKSITSPFRILCVSSPSCPPAVDGNRPVAAFPYWWRTELGWPCQKLEHVWLY